MPAGVVAGIIVLDPLRGRDKTAGGGRLAQLGERLVYTEEVGGSIPSSPTMHKPFPHPGHVFFPYFQAA